MFPESSSDTICGVSNIKVTAADGRGKGKLPELVRWVHLENQGVVTPKGSPPQEEGLGPAHVREPLDPKGSFSR